MSARQQEARAACTKLRHLGLTYARIARTMNRAGYREPQRGVKWDRVTVYKLLNPARRQP